jgi:sterol desaturase/sphingolipid hydroxylase (fatty acid hydroxylase superfamily)
LYTREVELIMETIEIKPQSKGTKQLFENPVLERLTRTHIAVPLIVFFFYASSLLGWSVYTTEVSVTGTAALFFAGWLVFSWVEYNVHRFIFHIPGTTTKRAKFQYTIHGVHHEYPKDKERLAMPPVMSVTIATILLGVFRLVMGDFAFSFTAGFIVGYSLYLWVHYMVHAYAPPKNFFKVLWLNHSLHHYKNGKMVFGVSSPLWDYIYGTMSKPTAAKAQ